MISVSGVSETIFLSSDPNENCDKKNITTKKQAAKKSDQIIKKLLL